jgi:hypothetical protein
MLNQAIFLQFTIQFLTQAGVGKVSDHRIGPRKYFPKKEKYNCKNLDKRINSEGKL